MAHELVRQSQGSLQQNRQLLTPSETALGRELALTADNSKTVLTDELSKELFRLYDRRSPDSIEFVFRTHRERSSFWPSIAELTALFGEHHRRQQEQTDQAYLEELRETRRRLDAAGLPSGEAQVAALRKQLLAIVKSMDEPTPERKNQLRQSLEQHLAAKRSKTSSTEKSIK